MKTTCSPLESELPQDGPATQWLSRGIEVLLSDLSSPSRREAFDFDVVIVGSGYGGSVAAAGLAGATESGRHISVCILERGREYLPGMFPSRMSQLAGQVRFSTPSSAAPRGMREGLFDIRMGPDLNAVVANGLGGGSLINAGVMESPHDRVFNEGWPKSITGPSLAPFFSTARELLGVEVLGTQDAKPDKYLALEALAGTKFRSAPITVALHRRQAPGSRPDEAEPSPGGVRMSVCKRCGDCATGCNHGAKGSLDVGLLVRARLAGAHVYTGATVLEVGQFGEGWALTVTYTDDKLRARHGGPSVLRARRVVLAAGAFGSTELLLRSQRSGLALSAMVGRRFSSNADLIASGYRQKEKVNAAACEDCAPQAREVGPTITGLLDLRTDSGDGGYVVEEMAVPGALRRLFEETVTTLNAFHDLAQPDGQDHATGVPSPDPCAVDAGAIEHSSVLAVMGHDGAGGELRLTPPRPGRDDGDGAVWVCWHDLPRAKVFEDELAALAKLHRDRLQPGGKVLPNPLWNPVPKSLDGLFEVQRGPLLTVHPLGGCPMGETIATGVVDAFGRVFRPDSVDRAATHDGLVVLDGSMVPTSLGINPSLTITALALRAVEELRRAWKLDSPAAWNPKERTRPAFRTPPVAIPRKATTIQIVERLQGTAMLGGASGRRRIIELSLTFRPVPVTALTSGTARELQVESGTVRIFRPSRWGLLRPHDADPVRDQSAEEVAPVEGSLVVFARKASTARDRRCRALRAWWGNRGKRDLWQSVSAFLRSPRRGFGGIGASTCDLKRMLFALATRAGELRTLEYRLQVANSDSKNLLLCAGEEIAGLKTLTYSPRSNPWKQLSRIALHRFPGLQAQTCTLELDLPFLAAKAIPLMRFNEQEDQPSALADLGSLALYVARMLLHIHVWSFRKPDDPPPAPPRESRLPGPVLGHAPEVTELVVGTCPDGTPAKARLSRYKPASSLGPPVVLIHGYSASGTTFAHPAVSPNLAGHLFGERRDVWVLDLRTSSGMPTCGLPWSFEEVGRADIPVAVDYIVRETRAEKIDIVAHCMGAAMLSIAVLEVAEPGCANNIERVALPARIRRIVFSQVGPAVAMSASNVLRAYVMQYLRFFFPLLPFDFRPPSDAGLLDQFMDRALATLPYPDREWHVENPPHCWQTAPFATTRHRMDALFGRVMNAEHMSRGVLDHIDELFGRINLDTLAQPMQFARLRRVTDRRGEGDYYRGPEFRKRLSMPILSLHACENGLADFATRREMRSLFYDMYGKSSPLHQRSFEGGHQDQLIGEERLGYFKTIAAFLDPASDASPANKPERSLSAPAATIPLMVHMPESVRLMNRGSAAVREVYAIPYQIAGDTLGVVFVPMMLGGTRVDVPGSDTLAGRIGAGAVFVSSPKQAGVPVTAPIPQRDPEPQAWMVLLVEDGPRVEPSFPEHVPGQLMRMMRAMRSVGNPARILALQEAAGPGQVDAAIARQIAALLESKAFFHETFEPCLIYP